MIQKVGSKWEREFRVIHSLFGMIAILFTVTGCAVAPPPTAHGVVTTHPPMTLPRFLGVDTVATGVRRVFYRSRVRASGWLPILEPMPASAAPLALGDPSCLESPAPAVAAAAAMQQADAAAPAKIKALAYLASMDSCRNPQVEEAFLAAMGDPSESVRIAAVQGIIDINGRCGGCSNGCGGCCTPAIQEKLIQLASGVDEKGCWCEPNAKVRRLARIGSCKCNATPIQINPPISEELPSPSVLELSRLPLPQ